MNEYTRQRAERQMRDLLQPHLGDGQIVIQNVPDGQPGDLAVPVFALAKKEGKQPKVLAEELTERIDLDTVPHDDRVLRTPPPRIPATTLLPPWRGSERQAGGIVHP
jgi:arginyl-tRNA synthetase